MLGQNVIGRGSYSLQGEIKGLNRHGHSPKKDDLLPGFTHRIEPIHSAHQKQRS